MRRQQNRISFPNRNRRSATLLVLFVLLVTVQVHANSDLQVSPGQMKFFLDTNSNTDTQAQKVVNFSWKNHADEFDVYYRLEGPLVKSSTNDVIPASKIYAITNYNASPQYLNNDVLFLKATDSSSSVTFFLSSDIQVERGEYMGQLVLSGSSDGPTITVKAHVDEDGTVSIDADNIHFNADNGPGVYDADNQPIVLTVNSSYDSWTLNMKLSGPLNCLGDEVGVSPIEPEAIRVGINNNSLSYDECQTLTPNGVFLDGSKSEQMDLYFKIKTKWEHRAGNYKGTLTVTLSSDD